MIRALKYSVAIPTGLVILFFLISAIVEFRPKEFTPVEEFFGADNQEIRNTLPDTLKIVSWNIGYAGLGDNMDFFMDGGKKVRDTEERTRENLASIIRELKESDADIILLQEVDRKAHRTYGIEEIREISESLSGYLTYYAPNFKVWFIPKPLREPIGSVDGGLVILTRIKPQSARRIQYPSRFPFPVSMFNLKRCLLEADFLTSGGKTVHILNTHCTAFDTGGMRTVENKYLKSLLKSYSEKSDPFAAGGDWNQYPPEYKPGKDELENQFFIPERFDTCGMTSFARVVCDTEKRSMRFNDAPYSSSSLKTILDFFVVSNPEIQTASMRIIDLNFKNSDHNPVEMTVTFR